jgi:TRAP-type C4-dicarboxylate transport system permease small subunit
LKIPVWIPQLIIPVTFTLMTLRFGFRAFEKFAVMFNSDNSSEHGSPS